MAETSLRSRAEGQDIFDHEFDQPRLRNGFSTQGGAAPELLPSGSSQSEVKESIADTVAKFLRARDFKTLAAMDVVFDQATVIGSGSGAQAAPTVTTMAKSAFGILEPIMNRFRPQSSRPILRQFSGTVNAGEMLLVIGKPGSGCTTFLKTLANMRDEYKETTGDITYGGRSSDDMTAKYPQDITFCAEEDDHFPTQSVAQTLRFALKARLGSKVSSPVIEENVALLAELFGLSGVLHTQVGNEWVRGVSGGERRRVSLAEALATCASLLCFDNPTGGLDSSTALELIEMLHEVTIQSRCATAMSIYQGSNALIPHFDKVVVMNSSRQIFYGKVADAKAYFEDLGFECPPTMALTDFLNSMSADADVRHVQPGKESQVPQTAEDFERAFKTSKYYVQTLEDVQQMKDTPKLELAPKSPKIYELPFYSQVWQCAFRQFRLLYSDYNTWGVEAICIIVQSLVLGTLFRNQQRVTQAFFILASAVFFAVLVPALQSMAEFQNTFAQRSLILKHKRYQFNRPGAYAFGLVITDMVWKIAAISYNIPLYFLTGFQYDAGKFFTYFFVVYIEHLALSMFFRSIAAFSSNTHKAVLPVAIFFNMYVIYTGLYIPPPNMQVWLGWLKYLNPLYYAFESVLLNEFAGLTYRCSPSDLAPAGPGYEDIANQVCAVVGSLPGQDTVDGLSYLQAQYGFQISHLWRNVGINATVFIAFAVCTGIGMERLKLPAGRLATVFYKAKPVDFATSSEKEFDNEKGEIEGATPPVTKQDTRQSHKSHNRVTDTVHTFAWNDINLDIRTKEGNRRLLNHQNGWVRSGCMKALMGVSGAGKTTLLNILAGRSDLGIRTGDLYLDGQALPRSFGRHMGYVQQQDIHLPTQTIREALQMTARLRQSAQTRIEEKYAYVEKVIEWLEMDEYADALIGVPGAGLNLEQRKRVTIGVEMAAKPLILFLDEPTSGLDGQSAVSIVHLLRKLADSGQAIICTIHQPAAELIGTFDELYLLARGGQLVYDGPLGHECRDAIQYFEQKARKCDPGENPAEYFFEVIGAGSRGQVAADWPQVWTDSQPALRRREMQHQVINMSVAHSTSESGKAHRALSDSDSIYASSYLTQLTTLLHRTWFYYWREPDYATSKLWMNVGNSLLNSLTYLQSPPTQRGAYNLVFSAFTSVIVGPALGLQVGPRFVPLRDIFVHRERASQAYHWTVFVLAAIIVELPYALLTSLVYWLLWYYPVGYTTATSRVGYSLLMYELFAVFATSLAQLCAAAMPHLGATFAANGFFFMVCNVFAGTLSPEPVTPSGWRWYYTVSPLFYYSDGVTANLMKDLPIQCTGDEVAVFTPPIGQTCAAYAAEFLATATGYLLNPESAAECQYCRYKDGQSYYQQYGFSFANRYRDFGAFIGFTAFNFTFVFVMTYLTKVKKWRWKWKRD